MGTGKQTNLGGNPKLKQNLSKSAQASKSGDADETVNGHVLAAAIAVGAPRRRGGRSGSSMLQRAAYLRLGWSSSSSVGRCCGRCVPERVTPNYGLYCRLRLLALMLPAAGVTAAQFRLARNLADEQTENRGDRGNRQRNVFGPLPGVRETAVCPPPSFVAGLAGIRSRMPVGLIFPSCGHYQKMHEACACRRCRAPG